MGNYGALVDRGMEVYIHEFSWVDEYFTCGCTTTDDIPLFNVSRWKGVRSFSKGVFFARSAVRDKNILIDKLSCLVR